jgi:hypothetical protein
MVADSKLTGILIGGTHAARPAATAVVAGATYSCSTHGLEYQSDGATWSTRSTFGGGYTPGGTDVAVADGGTGASTASAAATNLGLGTGDSPQFAGVNVGHASDTTITRTGAGDVAVEGNALYRAGGTDVPVTDGGTGASTASGARTNLGLVIGTDIDARVMTTQDDIIFGGASGAATRLGKGSDGQVLTVDPTTHHLIWATPSSGFADPMTTRGDMIVRNASNVTARVGIGSAGKVWSSDGTDPSWQTPASGGAEILLATLTASGSTSLDFTGISSTYNVYVCEIDHLVPSVDGDNIWLLVSTDGGSTFVTAGGSYDYVNTRASTAATGAGGSTSATKIIIDGSAAAEGVSGTASNGGLSGTLWVFNPLLSSAKKTIRGAMVYWGTVNGQAILAEVSGQYLSNTAVNAIRIVASTGNLASGAVRWYGITNS